MNKINKIPQVIIRIACILFIVFSVFVIISFLFNRNKIPGILKYKPVVVQNNVSLSDVKKGDFIIIEDINIKDYKSNDIVVYKKSKKNIVTKIKSINNKKNEIELSISNGDKIYKDRLQGKKIVRIPLLGYLFMFLQSIAGVIILILGIVLSFIWYKSKTKELES